MHKSVNEPGNNGHGQVKPALLDEWPGRMRLERRVRRVIVIAVVVVMALVVLLMWWWLPGTKGGR